jgi:hypothetical protein
MNDERPLHADDVVHKRWGWVEWDTNHRRYPEKWPKKYSVICACGHVNCIRLADKEKKSS